MDMEAAARAARRALYPDGSLIAAIADAVERSVGAGPAPEDTISAIAAGAPEVAPVVEAIRSVLPDPVPPPSLLAEYRARMTDATEPYTRSRLPALLTPADLALAYTAPPQYRGDLVREQLKCLVNRWVMLAACAGGRGDPVALRAAALGEDRIQSALAAVERAGRRSTLRRNGARG